MARGCLVSNPPRCGDQTAKAYCTRHTFTSVGLSNGVKIKWLGGYCGTSVATIERHYGKYIKSDAAEQLLKLAGTVTPTVTPDIIKHVAVGQAIEVIAESDWWRQCNSIKNPCGRFRSNYLRSDVLTATRLVVTR